MAAIFSNAHESNFKQYLRCLKLLLRKQQAHVEKGELQSDGIWNP